MTSPITQYHGQKIIFQNVSNLAAYLDRALKTISKTYKNHVRNVCLPRYGQLKICNSGGKVITELN